MRDNLPAADQEVIRLLEPHGLLILGSLKLLATDRVPTLSGDRTANSLLMIGNAGSSMWRPFTRSPEYGDGKPEPLDRWSRRIGTDIAEKLDGKPIFPFDGPPYPPILSWAARTGRVAASRIIISLHQQFGLWHAYRFVLVLPDVGDVDTSKSGLRSACLDCIDMPCLDVCPVDAFDGEHYQVGKCVEFLGVNKKSSCRVQGCKARRVCPVAKEFHYLPDHARFHMDAFVDTRWHPKTGHD
jgi:hypothetical protein